MKSPLQLLLEADNSNYNLATFESITNWWLPQVQSMGWVGCLSSTSPRTHASTVHALHGFFALS